MFKPSNNPKVLELTKSCKERRTNLDGIRPIKLEELNEKGKPRRLCAWCVSKEIFGGNAKYCSRDCSNSAMAWANPQKEDALRFLLIIQDWKCAHCQYDYRPQMQLILDKERSRRPYALDIKNETPLDKISWFYFKRLKNQVPENKKPEVDHIIPISKGGESLGIANHQVLCYDCHKTKTKVDNSGPRKKKI